MKRAIILALLAVLALPFALRTRKPSARAADDTVVIVSPHNEAIRYEFGRGFARWFRERTGRTVTVDWRVVGGTSDISRYLESAFVNAFEIEWSRRLHRPWSSDVQRAFQNPMVSADAPTIAGEARRTFLASNVSCGIDVFFGGDGYQFDKEARAGRLVDSGLRRVHPDWFRDEVLPESYGGEPFRDTGDRWLGVVLSSYGIIYNRDSWRRLKLEHEPKQWTDLADFRLVGELGLADPTKSGSVCEAFEAIIQQQMIRHHATLAPSARGTEAESAALRAGWTDGLRLIQRMGANARYFTDSSQKPPIDVSSGDCAAGLCIDFYGRQQHEALRRRGSGDRVGYISPVGGSAASTDPIGLLRGAPHRDAAVAFIEYTLSLEGQKLWAFRPGEEGGPERYALRRMPVRRDFYRHVEWKQLRSDPNDAPYAGDVPFVYHSEWTGSLFREIGFVTRVMCMDSHRELVDAWRAIHAAPEPTRSRAMAILENVTRVDYMCTQGEIHRILDSKDRVEEVRLASELSTWFRNNYERAAAVARRVGTE